MTELKPGNNEDQMEPHVYDFAVNYYFHQDKLSWGRIQLLIAVEGAILYGAYTMHTKHAELTWWAVILGSFLIFLIWWLAERDREIRDVNNDFLNKMHLKYGVRVGCDPKWPWFRGKLLLRVAILMILITNMALAYHLWYMA